MDDTPGTLHISADMKNTWNTKHNGIVIAIAAGIYHARKERERKTDRKRKRERERERERLKSSISRDSLSRDDCISQY